MNIVINNVNNHTYFYEGVDDCDDCVDKCVKYCKDDHVNHRGGSVNHNDNRAAYNESRVDHNNDCCSSRVGCVASSEPPLLCK